MYSLKSRLLHTMILLTVVIFSASCGSQRFYQGLNYQGSKGAPDTYQALATGVEKVAPEATLALPENQVAEIAPISGIETASSDMPALSGSEMDIEKVKSIARTEAAKMIEAGQEISHKNLSHQVSQEMVATGLLKQLTPAQERKMSKLAAKMDRKMKKQGKEIDWKHNSNLELFFMIMAIAGLVLGIIGPVIGWFVFIVFAGIWLYFKLVKD